MSELEERFFTVRFPSERHSSDAYWEMVGVINVEPSRITGRDGYMLDVWTFGKAAEGNAKRIITKYRGEDA